MGGKLQEEEIRIAENFALFVEQCSRHHLHVLGN